VNLLYSILLLMIYSVVFQKAIYDNALSYSDINIDNLVNMLGNDS